MKLKRNLIKSFLLIYAVCCYAVFLGVTTVYQNKISAQQEQLRLDQVHALSMREASLLKDFNVPFADARILAEVISQRLPNESLKDERLKNGLYAFADNKREYGQVRVLDDQGTEIIRINRDKNRTTIVHDEKLQNKSHRDYVQQAFGVGAGEVYVSPLDLNIENKKVEFPFVPVIRFASPIVDGKGVRHGLVVLNYYAEQMLQHFKETALESMSDVMLLNSQGYWLVADDKAITWRFMFKDKPQLIFQDKFPELWNAMQKAPTGQIESAMGLFTWSVISPAFTVTHKLGSGMESYPPISVSPYRWVAVQHVGLGDMEAMKAEVYDTCFWAFLIICISTGIVLWFLLFSIQRSQEHRKELEMLAHHDWLTGLSNLPHMFSKMEEACAKAVETGIPFHVMYIDLDDFKLVNDQYGHEAGNDVLRHVASVLKRNVRTTDVVARIGGDEYVILLDSMPDPVAADRIAKSILKSFEIPVVLEKRHKVYVKASIGIAGWSPEINGPDDLMKHADAAMYDSKYGGKNRISSYDPNSEKLAG